MTKNSNMKLVQKLIRIIIMVISLFLGFSFILTFKNVLSQNSIDENINLNIK